MRIWSLHPKYLDTKGLVALWRETLLAKHVLLNKTTGYRFHPQLTRFKTLKRPVDAIDFYLRCVWDEANNRNYHFNHEKISTGYKKTRLVVTVGQLEYERMHLLNKLEKRSPELYHQLAGIDRFDPHPLFSLKDGGIESWEII